VNSPAKSTPKRRTPLGSGVPAGSTRLVPLAALIVLAVALAAPTTVVALACAPGLLPPPLQAAAVVTARTVAISRSLGLIASLPVPDPPETAGEPTGRVRGQIGAVLLPMEG